MYQSLVRKNLVVGPPWPRLSPLLLLAPHSCPGEVSWSILVLIEGFRPSSKYLTIVDSVGAAVKSNSIKMDSKCSRWEAQSYTSSS